MRPQPLSVIQIEIISEFTENFDSTKTLINIKCIAVCVWCSTLLTCLNGKSIKLTLYYKKFNFDVITIIIFLPKNIVT